MKKILIIIILIGLLIIPRITLSPEKCNGNTNQVNATNRSVNWAYENGYDPFSLPTQEK